MDIDPQDFAQEDYGIYDPPELGGVDGMSGGQATPGAEFADQNPKEGGSIALVSIVSIRPVAGSIPSK